MEGNPDREPPFFFAEPADALVAGGGEVPFPPATERLDHGIELIAVV